MPASLGVDRLRRLNRFLTSFNSSIVLRAYLSTITNLRQITNAEGELNNVMATAISWMGCGFEPVLLPYFVVRIVMLLMASCRWCCDRIFGAGWCDRAERRCPPHVGVSARTDPLAAVLVASLTSVG